MGAAAAAAVLEGVRDVVHARARAEFAATPFSAASLGHAVAYAVSFHSAGLAAEASTPAGEGKEAEEPLAAVRAPPLLVPEAPAVAPAPAGLRLRLATSADAECVVHLVEQLTLFERLPASTMRLSVEDVRRDGFGAHPFFHVLLATVPSDDAMAKGAPAVASAPGEAAVAMAIVHAVYSTWNGVGVFLEDLFVAEDARKLGLGTRLVTAVATAAHVLACRRVSWVVLDWNTPALKAYERLGASRDDGWVQMALSEPDIARLAGERSPPLPLPRADP